VAIMRVDLEPDGVRETHLVRLLRGA